MLLAALAARLSPPGRRRSSPSPGGWRVPTGRDMARYYPERAQRFGINGAAIVSCNVTAVGTLESCTVVEETPSGFGFGVAALRMTPLFKMEPNTADGAPVGGGTVRIPIRFSLPR